MNFSNLKIYQKDVVRILDNSFKKNRLVHTYLFVGAKGTLKMEAALYLASLILCENEGACGKCQQCQLIFKRTNPNLFIISPDGDTIKKEQINALEHEFSLLSSHKRVFIIDQIDKATAASANSLLKFLEESGDNNYGILLTENVGMVLPTIKSRSQTINFLPINRQIIYNELINHHVMEEVAAVVSTLTNNIDEALALSDDKIIIKIIEFAKVMGIGWENSDNMILLMSEQGKFLLSESNKIYHNFFLDILITLQNDKIKMMVNEKKDIVFKELLETTLLHLPQAKEIKILEIILELKTKIRYNVNMELAYLQMLIDIARC